MPRRAFFSIAQRAPWTPRPTKVELRNSAGAGALDAGAALLLLLGLLLPRLGLPLVCCVLSGAVAFFTLASTG